MFGLPPPKNVHRYAAATHGIGREPRKERTSLTSKMARLSEEKRGTVKLWLSRKTKAVERGS